jgi:hypothetical protein
MCLNNDLKMNISKFQGIDENKGILSE